MSSTTMAGMERFLCVGGWLGSGLASETRGSAAAIGGSGCRWVHDPSPLHRWARARGEVTKEGDERVGIGFVEARRDVSFEDRGMVGKGSLQLVEAARGELGKRAAPITGTSDSIHEPVRLQPVDPAREPARRQVRPLGKLVHPELLTWLVGEREEHGECIGGEHRAGPPVRLERNGQRGMRGRNRLPEADRDRDRGSAGSGVGCSFDAGTQGDIHCTCNVCTRNDGCQDPACPVRRHCGLAPPLAPMGTRRCRSGFGAIRYDRGMDGRAVAGQRFPRASRIG